jgi:hypothetical protein
VLHAKCWLFQDETLLRARWENAPPAIGFNDLMVIALWIVSKNGQLEPILAIGLGVAASSIATSLAQYRQDIVDETERFAVEAGSTVTRTEVVCHLNRASITAIPGFTPRMAPAFDTSAMSRWFDLKVTLPVTSRSAVFASVAVTKTR